MNSVVSAEYCLHNKRFPFYKMLIKISLYLQMLWNAQIW